MSAPLHLSTRWDPSAPDADGPRGWDGGAPTVRWRAWGAPQRVAAVAALVVALGFPLPLVAAVGGWRLQDWGAGFLVMAGWWTVLVVPAQLWKSRQMRVAGDTARAAPPAPGLAELGQLGAALARAAGGPFDRIELRADPTTRRCGVFRGGRVQPLGVAAQVTARLDQFDEAVQRSRRPDSSVEVTVTPDGRAEATVR